MSRWTGGHPLCLLVPRIVHSEATHGTSWTGNRSPIYPPGETSRKQKRVSLPLKSQTK